MRLLRTLRTRAGAISFRSPLSVNGLASSCDWRRLGMGRLSDYTLLLISFSLGP